MHSHYTLLFLLFIGHLHLEVDKTLVPVLQSVHKHWQHTGGGSVIRNGLKGFF